MRAKLAVAIIWHMHQPYYKHPQTNEFALPWVRLHASKDYLHMAKLLQHYPGVRANFTIVPSLREQLEDYAQGASDVDADLTLRAVEGTLTPDEREHALHRFFSISHGNVIGRYPEYQRLLDIAKTVANRAELLSEEYFVDLAVWFNLAWIDPEDIEADEQLRALVVRGHSFTRDDLRSVLRRQRFMATGVPHLYHRLETSGQVELLTVPYFHPILPLLIDSRSALRSDSGAAMPEVPFAEPDDAALQLEEAVASHTRSFGRAPRGVWPPEQAVSPEAADLIAAAGLSWFVSDEGVLERSMGARFERDEIGALKDPALLYRPYKLANGTTAIFRDREISDKIGFAYGDMAPLDAVGDIIWKLERARDRLPDDGGPYMAVIALDGENAWEGYPNNGNDFLRTLYNALATDERFETVRISEFLDAHPATEELPALHTGSWIDANLRVWFGEPAHARAWAALARTRKFAAEQWGPLRSMPQAVRRALMVAEGSDWFWWYSSRNASPEESDFDELFRANLEVVWWYAGTEPPPEIRAPLAAPIVAEPGRGGAMLPGVQREDAG